MNINIDGIYINPTNKNHTMTIDNKSYIMDYNEDCEIEIGKVEIINNTIYITKDDISITNKLKYKIGTLKDNNIEKLYNIKKKTKRYTLYTFFDNLYKISMKLFIDGTFIEENKNKIDTFYKKGIYRKSNNEIELFYKEYYEKNIFKIKKSHKPIYNNYYKKCYIDINGNLCMIEFIKR